MVTTRKSSSLPTQAITNSAPCAAWDGVAATCPPKVSAQARALACVLLKTVTSCPARCKCPAIGYPITPSPKKATFATAIPPVIGFLVVSLCVTGCKGLKHSGVTRMKNLFQWMLRIATAAIVLATIATGFAFYLAWRSLPNYDKTLEVTGLTDTVEIVRDTANVPHIFGTNDPDVFFGLGYAHAQDRLWQMTILRRIAQGRLSEIFGPRTLNTDILLRSLDLNGLAKTSLAAQTPDTLAALHSYAQGINARIAEINATALGRGAPEMFVFDVPFAPWQPADSIAIQKLMALQLSGQAARDILYAKTSLTLPFPDRIDDIFPAFPGAPILDLPEYSDIVPIKDDQHFANMIENNAANGFDILYPITDYALAGASNAFAAAPARSATGGSLLANYPHLGLTAPGVFYLARLELATGGVIGGTIPGMPFVLVGRNKDLAWGMTTSYLDDQDIVMEEINPTRTNEYRTQTGWAQIETTPSIIQVKGQAPVTIDTRKTKNGPVLPKTLHHIDQITPQTTCRFCNGRRYV